MRFSPYHDPRLPVESEVWNATTNFASYVVAFDHKFPARGWTASVRFYGDDKHSEIGGKYETKKKAICACHMKHKKFLLR